MAEEQERKSVSELIEELTERANKLREELMDMEREFNTKKEEFVKIQGALEAFNYVKGPDIVV
jgi:predicted CopG family antitoxin